MDIGLRLNICMLIFCLAVFQIPMAILPMVCLGKSNKYLYICTAIYEIIVIIMSGSFFYYFQFIK